MPSTVVPPAAPPDGPHQRGARAARSVMLRLLDRLDSGTVTVTENGRSRSYGRGGTGAHATIRIADPRAWSLVARRGSVGLGEAYTHGWWTSDDLIGLLRMMLRHWQSAQRGADRAVRAARPVVDTLGRVRRRRDAAADRRNIEAHYDIGNRFFELFLDESMAYSCAVFAGPETDLADASRAKFDRLCRKLDLRPGDRLLEIGTGWGGLAVHAATVYGAQVTTTTISREQFEYARDLVDRRGLAGRVTVLDADYRDLRGTFDKLVSVEMIEAVDWRDHDTFMSTCAARLAPEGVFALQAIVIADQSYDRSRLAGNFISDVVFPGGCLPSVEAVVSSAARTTDMRLVDLEDIGAHYAETLSRWRAALLRRRHDVAALGLPESLVRMWDFYFAFCEAGFLERQVSDVQMVFARRAWRGTLAPRAV